MKRFVLLLCSMAIAVFAQRHAIEQTAGAWSPGDPELPRVLLDTTYAPPGGNTINVAAGGNLQAALNAANAGDTIVLQAGATYTAPPEGFVLPNKAGAGWLVIRTSNMSGIPVEGTRAGPSHASAMPKIVTTGVWPAMKTAPNAHHYRLIGIEFTMAPNLPFNYGIVTLGDGSSAQNSLGVVPHDIIIDRSYIHGTDTADVSRGVALNSARTAIIDSYVSNIHGRGLDTQAVAGWNGPGPFKIVNNYLEGAAENVMFGGADPHIFGLVPSDIEFRRNSCSKPLSWRVGHPTYAGIRWTIKNLLELKNAARVLMDGNIFEYNWRDGHDGTAVVFTVRNQDGTAPWSVVEDITFTNNIVRHAAGGINILGTDYNFASGQGQRIKIKNNLFDDLSAGGWGDGVNGRFLVVQRANYLTIDHNTILQSDNIITATGLDSSGNPISMAGFSYTNNIAPHNNYGIIGDNGGGIGNATMSTYFPGGVLRRSLFAGGPSHLYPSENFFPASLNDVGFADRANGNYRLIATSPYKNAATDGTDVGADIEAIEAAMRGGPPLPPLPPSDLRDIVLYAAEAAVKVGNWVLVSDASAAGGTTIFNPDAGAAKINTALISPRNYFEMSFTAQAGQAYRLWVRGKAQNNHWANDSAFVQFSGSVDANGAALYRIGTTSATVVSIEEGNGAGVSNWGWQDNGYGYGVLGPLVYFQATGTQTLRVQVREDGLSIDQIVLSPQAYLNASPGSLMNDTTILPKTVAPPPPLSNIVIWASDILDSEILGNWSKVFDSGAAGQTALRNPDQGAAKINTALTSPRDYFEVSFNAQAGQPYRLWIRGKAQNDYWGNDSVHVQFSDSTDSSGMAAYRIGTTSATVVNIEDCSGCGVSNWGWQDNGYGTAVLGPVIYFQGSGPHRLRVQVREDGVTIDQIVLSPATYLNISPGALKNDTTVLPRM